MSVKQAFKVVIAMQGREMTYKRPDAVPVIGTITAAPSNYFRQTIGPEEITINSNEVVVMADSFTAINIDKPKKGDRIIDTIFGDQQIDRVLEMIIMGELIAYRVRFR